MTSGNSSAKVAPVNGEDKKRGDLPVMGGRAEPEQIRLVDMACAKVGKKRGHFVVEVAVREAKKILHDAA